MLNKNRRAVRSESPYGRKSRRIRSDHRRCRAYSAGDYDTVLRNGKRGKKVWLFLLSAPSFRPLSKESHSDDSWTRSLAHFKRHMRAGTWPNRVAFEFIRKTKALGIKTHVYLIVGRNVVRGKCLCVLSVRAHYVFRKRIC